MHTLRYSVLAIFIVFFSCLSAQGQAPRAYFSFDGTTADTSGAGVVTSVTPSAGWVPTYGPDRNSVASRALDISAGSRSLQIVASSLVGNSNQALGLRNAGGTNTSFTLSAWVFCTNVSGGYNTVFGNLGAGAGTLHAGLGSGVATTHFGFDGNDAAGATVGLSPSVWYHLAFVYDAAGQTQRIYINGTLEVTRAGVTNTLKVADLLIGNWGTTTDATNDFRGRLDDVAVYNVALAGDRISALASGVSPIAPPAISSFTISDANPLFGAESQLSWATSGATTVAIDQSVGTVAASGTAPVLVYQTTTYTLSATNSYGTTTAAVTVNQPVPIGVAAPGFVARRVSSKATAPFPYAGLGYLDSAVALVGETVGGAHYLSETSGTFTTVNFADGTDGDFTTGNNTFPGGSGDNYAVRITATLIVNTPGEYTFVVNSDDGARLRIDGVDVTLDDGTHTSGSHSGKITLNKPTTTLELICYEVTGSAHAELGWIRPNLQWQLLGIITAAPAIVRGQVLISEFVANNSALLDEDGATSDWLELWNSTAATVNLAGYYLTDDPLVPNKWALPAWTLGANRYAVVFASLNNRKPAQAVAGQDNPGTLAQPHLHTNFKLSKTGGYLALTQNNGSGGYNVVSFFSPYPIQTKDVSYGSTDTEAYVGFMETPTPGQPNSNVVSGFVSDTDFSVSRGRYSAPFNLSISTLTPGCTIRYTTDGSTPTRTRGTIYSVPINIAATTVVRAFAYRLGWKAANIDTHTYLFVDDIVTQSAATATALGFPTGPIAPRNQVLRYGMTLGNVTAAGGTLQDLKNALVAAPTVCMTTDVSNLMDATSGIYARADQHGLFWERPMNIEYLNTAGTSEFHILCGARIRGGYSRSAGNPKHAFHLYFRSSLYDGKLNYRLFGTSGASTFGQIDMRCEENYSWSFASDSQNSLMREEWSRTTERDMGQPYARNGYFHVYINGIYWGIYNWEERTEASFGETYLGGNGDNYDTVKSTGSSGSYNTEMTDGNNSAWESLYRQAIALKNDATTEANRTAKYMQMRGLNADGTSNPAYPVLLDVDNLVDYMLVIFYDGSFDAPLSTFLSNASNNWFGVRDRTGTRGFAYFAHDNEHGMDSVSDGRPYNRVGPWGGTGANNWGQNQYGTRETLTNTFYTKSNPQYLHEMLAYSAEYRLRFADRVQRHFFNGGALTTTAATARVNTLAAQVSSMIHAEAARWGSGSLNKTSWLSAKTTVLNFINNGGATQSSSTNFGAQTNGRNSLLLQQLSGYQDPLGTAKALFPAVAAPTFSGQFGGLVSSGYTFTITATGGTLYYTTNGTDPRAIGGGIAAGALTAASPASLILTQTSPVKARVLNTGTSTWSALTEASYVVGIAATASNLVISKIHYNPSSSTDLEEFIEIMNIGAQTLDLTGCKFTFGVLFDFPTATTLAPGERALIIRDSAGFSAAYPGVPSTQILGTFSNNTNLSNSGEQLQLLGSTGATIRDFSYQTSGTWPSEPDGHGPALVLRHPELNPDPSIGTNWRESANAGGTPGDNDALSYTDWASLYGIADPLGTADPDGDGLTNLMEYALGTDPLSTSLGVLPTAGTQSLSVGGILGTYLTLTYTRVIGRDDVAYTVEYSNNLQAAWIPATLESGPTFNNNGTETLTYRALLPLTSETKQFLHLKMVR